MAFSAYKTRTAHSGVHHLAPSAAKSFAHVPQSAIQFLFQPGKKKRPAPQKAAQGAPMEDEPLEVHLDRPLENPGRLCTANPSETPAVQIHTGIAEVRMVQHIERLQPQRHRQLLVQRKAPTEGRVDIEVLRPNERIACFIPILPLSILRKLRYVEPRGVQRRRAQRMRVQVRRQSVPVRPVGIQAGLRVVLARRHAERRARGPANNRRQLPVVHQGRLPSAHAKLALRHNRGVEDAAPVEAARRIVPVDVVRVFHRNRIERSGIVQQVDAVRPRIVRQEGERP